MTKQKWFEIRNLTKGETDVAKWLQESMDTTFNDPDFLRDNPDAPQPGVGESGQTLDNQTIRLYIPSKGNPSLKGHSGRLLHVLRHPTVLAEVEDKLTHLFPDLIDGHGAHELTPQARTAQIEVAARLWEKIKNVRDNPWKYA